MCALICWNYRRLQMNADAFSADEKWEMKNYEKWEMNRATARIGTRLRSRLYEMCNAVVIEGEDYRKSQDRR